MLGVCCKGIVCGPHLCTEAMIYTIVDLGPFILFYWLYSIAIVINFVAVIVPDLPGLFALELELSEQLLYAAQSEDKLSFRGGRKLNSPCRPCQDCLRQGNMPRCVCAWGPDTPEAPRCYNLKRHTGRPTPQ